MKPPESRRAGSPVPAGDPNIVRHPLAADSPRVPRRWAWHYRSLLALRERLLAERTHQRESAAEPLEPHSMDLADSATDEFDHDMVLRGLSAGQELLVQVDAALQRILDGTYGVCLETGRPIPAQRLRAIPWASFGVAAERRLEAQGGGVTARLGSLRSVREPITGDIEDSVVDEDEAPVVRAEDESLREIQPLEGEPPVPNPPPAAPRKEARRNPRRTR